MFQPAYADWYLPKTGVLRCKWHFKDVTARACQKDRQAFTLLYEYYKRPLGRRLMALVNNHETAEDLYQETFIRAWQRITPEMTDYITPWLYNVARNLAIDYLRHATRLEFVPLPSETTYQKDTNEASIVDSWFLRNWELRDGEIDELLLLIEAIADMSPQYRVCLVLNRHWGFKESEIAARLDISPKTVSANVSRGYKQFIELFLEKHPRLGPPPRLYSLPPKKKVPSLRQRIIHDYVLPNEPPVIPAGLSPRLQQLWQEEIV